ncbi:MAG: hypothetical protein ACHP84_00550 [Caulobacterales bacterium]|jgi:hypothetical protein
MNPTLPEILNGAAVALSTPAPPEAAGDYTASKIGMVASMCALAAQEAERGVAACVAENGAMRALFAGAERYDGALGGRLAKAAAGVDTDFNRSALDATNAELRKLLIALHESAEAASDRDLDHRILKLYRNMAHWRRLELARG